MVFTAKNAGNAEVIILPLFAERLCDVERGPGGESVQFVDFYVFHIRISCHL